MSISHILGLLVPVGILAFILLYLTERNKRIESEEKNKRLQDVVRQLDEQTRLIIKTDLALNKVQEELDKKITGLYTLHELGKRISATLNIDDLFTLITQPLVSKLGFSRALIAIKGGSSGAILVKTSIGYSLDERNGLEKELNKETGIVAPLFKKSGFLLVNRDLAKIEHEDRLSSIFKIESFLTVPIVAKDEAIGFILMGNVSSYSKVTEGDAELISVLTSQIGTAIENA